MNSFFGMGLGRIGMWPWSAVTKRRDPGSGGWVSSNPERDLPDHVFAGCELHAFEDFAGTVSHDFREPCAGVDGDKEGALGEAHRVRVGDDGGIDGALPHLDDLGFRLALINADAAEDIGEDVGDRPIPPTLGLLGGAKVHAAPLGEGLIA